MKKKKRKIVLLILLVIIIIGGLGFVEYKWGVKKIWQSYFAPGKTVVVLDAGHGEYDPGCGLGEPYEKEIALNIVKQTQQELEKEGFVVILTREDDTFVSLGDRVLCSRIYNGNLFVSVHLNWAEDSAACGIETYCNEGLNADSTKLADAVQKNVVAATKSMDRGVHNDSNFYVVRNSKVPSCLVEVGFLSAKEEGANLKKKNYQKKVASAIAAGVQEYVNALKEE